MRVLLAIVLTMVFPAAASAAQRGRAPCPQLNAVTVLDFAGSPSGYRLSRAGQTPRVRPYTRLQNDDRLEVIAPDGRLDLQMQNGPPRPLRRADGPHCIRIAGASRPGRIFDELAEKLMGRRQNEAWPGTGRGDERGTLSLGLPDLAAGTALVAGGERRMALLWRGGAQPFSVQISDPRGRMIVDERAIYPRMLLLDAPRRLVPGTRYEVIVRDRSGTEVRGAFRALPPDAAILAARSEPESLAEAGRLYSAGPQRAFDAFMLLSPHFREREGTTPGWMMLLLTQPRQASGR
jgi:hypothetical protein